MALPGAPAWLPEQGLRFWFGDERIYGERLGARASSAAADLAFRDTAGAKRSDAVKATDVG